MNYQPFSVAISVYKNDNLIFFDRALESITVKQTVKPNEVVLVVDGPVPDEINVVIEKYNQLCNLKVIRFEVNSGLGNALKIAVENCSNELIARMDSDDVSVENRFEQQLLFYNNNPDVDIVGGNISEFYGNEDNITGYRNVPTTDEEIKLYTKKRCPFNHMTVMYKKSSVINAGGYLDWHYNEDYYLWIRMLLNKSVFANTGTTLVNVRCDDNLYKRRGGLKYYRSEKAIQRLMFDKNIINRRTYFINCLYRFVGQVLMPNWFRGFIYKHVLRK